MLNQLNILLARPRGFCAGVDRAVKIVERSLDLYGAPVYVRHEIVHNKHVVDSLKQRGAIFVKELSDIPDTDIAKKAPVIFSAHGVPKSVPANAALRNMEYIDATCPLVSKVHKAAERWHKAGAHVILIGHAGHPEVIGTMGQLPEGAITLVETVEDVSALQLSREQTEQLAYATQTTLSLDETADIIAELKEKYTSIQSGRKDDICYATTNRQQAVRNIAPQVDAFIVIGAENSSNSKRLVETARQYGCEKAILLSEAKFLQKDWLQGVQSLGISAGASAPEELVIDLISQCKQWFTTTITETGGEAENVAFNIPRQLRSDAYS